MNKILLSVVILSLVGIALFNFLSNDNGKIISPIGEKISQVKEKPLEKYAFDRLKTTKFTPSEISLGKVLKDENGVTSYMFYFTVDSKKVSGLVNLPQKAGTYPIIVMFRGYVDQKIYTTGEGTRHAGEVFAQNNFIALAPDFLGYGESDKPSDNSVEERLQAYVTALTLLSSFENLNKALEAAGISDVQADPEKIGIWGHSNGGQIALSTMEISGKKYPTVLWAPVSKPFPYSVLYYTDEFDDHGKILRKVIADFEKDYDAEKYSLTNFLDWIKGPIQLHQGGADEAVPQKWSDQLVENLKKLGKDVTYFTYPGENHNFSKGSWSTIVVRDTSFYRDNFR